MQPSDRIIFPLDVSDIAEAQKLVTELKEHVGLFKVGLELMYSSLASVVADRYWHDNAAMLHALFGMLEGRVFLDGKFDDKEITVGRASSAVSRMDVRMFSVHASAGRKAVKAAVANKGRSQVLGVTVLTSLGEAECISIFGNSPGDKVLQFAKMLAQLGADGIICSPQELKLLSQYPKLNSLLKVIPGIRPSWSPDTGDQRRVMTPGEAMRAGADYIVVGQPIRNPKNGISSLEAAKRIAEEISQVS